VGSTPNPALHLKVTQKPEGHGFSRAANTRAAGPLRSAEGRSVGVPSQLAGWGEVEREARNDQLPLWNSARTCQDQLAPVDPPLRLESP